LSPTTPTSPRRRGHRKTASPGRGRRWSRRRYFVDELPHRGSGRPCLALSHEQPSSGAAKSTQALAALSKARSPPVALGPAQFGRARKPRRSKTKWLRIAAETQADDEQSPPPVARGVAKSRRAGWKSVRHVDPPSRRRWRGRGQDEQPNRSSSPAARASRPRRESAGTWGFERAGRGGRVCHASMVASGHDPASRKIAAGARAGSAGGRPPPSRLLLSCRGARSPFCGPSDLSFFSPFLVAPSPASRGGRPAQAAHEAAVAARTPT